MNEIIGRNKEKICLKETLYSKKAEFLTIYGRRRVGKTYLIRNFFLKQKCVFFQNVGIYKGNIKTQLEQFIKEVGLTFYNGANIKTPSTWMEAFEEINNAINQQSKTTKIVLFFDEFPWMVTRKSQCMNALEYYWNRYWSNNKNLKLIICGSSASWIIKNIVNNRGGLHNRITKKICLLPFTLRETLEYLQYTQYKCNKNQISKIYMVTGGVPFYLSHFNKKLSIDQNINTLFFDPNGIFFNEFNEIFASLFDNSEQYREIISLLSVTKDGISRSLLEAKNKLTGIGGRLTKRLEDLEYAGFISSYLQYGHKARGVYYRISDEYCYFYHKWILPIKSKLKQNPGTHYWSGIINTPAYYNWMGYAFENICYKHLSQIRKKLKINEISLASPLAIDAQEIDSEKGTQIDLLFDCNDNSIVICEIKYTKKPFKIDKQYANNLLNKIEAFKKKTKTNKQIFIAIISANGLQLTKYSEQLISNYITLDDLF